MVSPGSSATYSPAPISLIIESERSGNLTGSAAFSLVRNSSRALESGVLGSIYPCSSASSTIRSQRFGVRTTRRIEGNFFDERYRAVTPFAPYHEILNNVLCAVLFFDFEI